MHVSPFARLLGRTRACNSHWRIAAARWSGAQIGEGCAVAAGCDLTLGATSERQGRIVLGRECRLEQGVVLHPYGGYITTGNSVFFGPGAIVYGHGGVEIGHDTLISMYCRILSSNHTIPPADVPIRSQPDIPLPTKIGRDVWLGAGTTVLGGVTIGDGSVIGAGSVVSRDIPPQVIAVGAPARVIRQRK